MNFKVQAKRPTRRARQSFAQPAAGPQVIGYTIQHSFPGSVPGMASWVHSAQSEQLSEVAALKQRRRQNAEMRQEKLTALAAFAQPALADGAEERNGFADLLQELTSDRRRAIDAIREGFPASLLKDTSVYFKVPANRIRSIVRLPETTAHALIKRGANMDAAASERIWRLADLVAMAQNVFEDEDAAKAWLRTPNRAFRDVAPMDYLDTEPGAMSVRQVLNAIATGGAA